jgi:4-diphosphocytidyl-2-C-methyl-D-erythritol kinase
VQVAISQFPNPPAGRQVPKFPISSMLVFPNCKINLGLNIIRKREDGYHDLETVFYPVGLRDALEMVKPGDSSLVPSAQDGVEFSSSGTEIAGLPANNLCVKACQLLKKDFPGLPLVKMHLHKAIPLGAGLGGGSADGAFALQLLDKLFELNLTIEQLSNYALALGSDCPFFIHNKPCFATGRGEKMEEIALDLSQYSFVIVHPGIHISTTDAFKNIKPGKPQRSIREIIHQPVSDWKTLLVNDFEDSVHRQYPQIAAIKNELYELGAVYASMTGSGSAVYGLFEKNAAPKFPPDYQYPTWLV